MNTTPSLPTPRALLTSLISSLPPIASSAHTTTSNRTGTSTNPLKHLPPSHRPLLTTLHVLYPTILLPALDLLDRHLVTRVVSQTSHPTSHTSNEAQNEEPADDEPEASQASDPASPQKEALYHLVRSAQPQSTRKHYSHTSSFHNTGGGQAYVVRLEAWNCSCAAFAFSAFPPLPSSSNANTSSSSKYQIAPAFTRWEDSASGMAIDEPSEDAWEFGGLSMDGRKPTGVDGSISDDMSGGVPCCKHLLACVLAERWKEVLGQYMDERAVGREEAAGLVGDL
ncbi:hypothetical protein GGR57DRAFT_353692 [Xylariaceae sp. FL1272]|nr:hypothetical protein GGR57DRAFT_353692 [Xylariaceae sp. FL1272]